MRKGNWVALSFLCGLISAPAAQAQVAAGTINVEVQDTSGAVVPDATVILTRTATGEVRQGKTNERGVFRAAFMPLGAYVLVAKAPGFKRTTLSGLELRVDQDANITVTLSPGDVVETIE